MVAEKRSATAAVKDSSANALARTACQALLFASLLISNVGQRLAFKDLGYVLGPYPYFVLLSVSGSFVVLFGVLCAGIVLVTGGWLPETRTWGCLAVFAVIGVCNAVQGAGMVFANPHVPGSLQALLQQSVIPFTLAASALALGARFSPAQYAGVGLIVAGIFLELFPSRPTAVSSAEGGATAFDPRRQPPSAGFLWPLLFVVVQLPVAAAAILQERAFQAKPVNVFHMMFWASTSQFLALVLLAPLEVLDAGSLAAFSGRLAAARLLVLEGEAGRSLIWCVVTMLLSQLAQALMVKHSSATFAVLCMACAVPASALAFTSPRLVGAARCERLGGWTPAALALVFSGVLLYRLGGSVRTSETKATERPLLAADAERSSATPRAAAAVPPICAAGVGIIQSEYSNSSGSLVRIWEERTLRELTARGCSDGCATDLVA